MSDATRDAAASSPPWLEEAGAARPGQAIDAAALLAWCRATVPALFAPSVTALDVGQFAGGYSNLTYLVRGGEREVVLRRAPPGVAPGPAHDMVREHRVLSAVWPVTRQVPEPLGCCADPTVLGSPFYLMTRLRGVIVRDAPPRGITLDAATMDRLCEGFVAALAALHAVDITATGLQSLGRADGYVARQVDGWTRRWQAARTVDVPAMERLAEWLSTHQPATSGGATLLHNDFKFDNLVLDPDDLARVIGVLDWEMATVGDPLMDLGTTLAYWVEPDDPPLLRALGLGVTARDGSWTRATLAARYAARTGRALTGLAFYQAFGRFKLAVVAQQLHARYVRGGTTDARFAQLGAVVPVLAAQGIAEVA